MMWQARPTTYKGIRMRSRLEASFAADLDESGAVWVYEPRAYANERGQYLPDFQLLSVTGNEPSVPWFFEVRPTVERAFLAMERMAIIWDSEPDAHLWVIVPNEVSFHARSGDGKWSVAWTEAA